MHSRFPVGILPSKKRYRPTIAIVFASLLIILLLLFPFFVVEKKKDSTVNDNTNGQPLVVTNDPVVVANNNNNNNKPPELNTNNTKSGNLILNDTIILTEDPPKIPKPTEDNMKSVNEQRQEAVRKAFRFAYESYEKQCLGRGEEVKPVSGTCNNWLLNGMELTLIDSIDTIIILNEHEIYNRSREYLYKNLNWNKKLKPSFFEVTIRCLGGLLSAFDLTKDEFYLKKAQELADKLMPVFNTPSGFPRSYVDFETGESSCHSWNTRLAILSEVGTIQMEFAYLAAHTKEKKYAEKALAVYDKLMALFPSDKLFPSFLNPEDGTLSNNNLVTIGSFGDSFYEYLLKYWLLTKKTTKYGEFYFEVLEALIDKLAFSFTGDDGEEYWYFAELNSGVLTHKFDHLGCFIGGTLALGAQYTSNPEIKEKHMKIAKGMANFCHKMYTMTPTGLPYDVVHVVDNRIEGTTYNKGFFQRPEAIESWFVLYRLTNDTKYQEWGWQFFESIEKYTKFANGYSGLRNPWESNPDPDDYQQSFFLAETLKYLYLLFSPTDYIDLEKYVFNTEAHPLSKFDSIL